MTAEKDTEVQDLVNEAIRQKRRANDALDGVAAAGVAMEAVRELHKPVEIEPSETVCAECSWRLPSGRYSGRVVEWPCPTLTALDGGVEDA